MDITLSVVCQANVWNIDIARFYFKHVKSVGGVRSSGGGAECEGGRRHSTGDVDGRYGRRRGAAARLPTDVPLATPCFLHRSRMPLTYANNSKIVSYKITELEIYAMLRGEH